jgi:hypothetical protein
MIPLSGRISKTPLPILVKAVEKGASKKNAAFLKRSRQDFKQTKTCLRIGFCGGESQGQVKSSY